MKKILLLFFYCFTVGGFAQLQTKDSILFYLNNAKGIQKTNYLKKATDLAYQFGKDSLILQSNTHYGIRCYFIKDTSGLAVAKTNLYNLYKTRKDSFALAKVYHFDALLHRINYRMDSSFYYYHKSKNLSILLKDSIEIGRRLLSMSIMQGRERDNLGSEITAIEALRYIEPTKDYRYLSALYIRLGIVLGEFKRFDEARAYYRKAITIGMLNPLKSSRQKDSLNTVNSIAITYFSEGNYKKAISLCSKALQFDSLEYKYPKQYIVLLGNLSNSKFYSGKKKEGMEGFKKVLALREKNNDIRTLSTSHSILAHANWKLGDNKLARFHAKKGIEFGEKSNYSSRILECLDVLAKVSNPKEAKGYLERYIDLKDSLVTRERNLKNQFAKVRYETEKKDKENTTLKVENEKKELLLEREEQRKLIAFLIAGGFLLVIIFGISIVNTRRKKLLFQAKLQQVEVREKERQQIAKSLHDEVAGDIRMLHKKLENNNLLVEAKELDKVKENVRTLSHQLSSVRFSEVSFAAQLVNLISDFFDVDVQIIPKGIHTIPWKTIDDAIKRTLYLSIRESIQNAIHHGQATKIILEFSLIKTALLLNIIDNGKGFDDKKKKEGIGLKNIKERIEDINGKFTVESELAKGTTIHLEIPKYGK